jgi:hypothetical protein
MTRQKIYKYSLVLISLFLPLSLLAQQPTQKPQQQIQQETRGVQYNQQLDSIRTSLKKKPLHLLEGMSVSGDLLGLVMYEVAHYGQIEGAFRLNLKGRYFPIVELGLGHSDYTDDETSLHFKTNSPYARIGCDYNFAKDLYSGNRVFGGLRYGYSKVKYDLSGPDLIDPIWQQHVPYQYKNLNANCSWAEMVFGLEAKIWSHFHIGWTVRYRLRISQKESHVGQAWYVPGYGKNDSHNFGGTFNLVFDI